MNTVKTILFAENDPVALEMYCNRLQREGFHVESAQDGLDALRFLSQLTPDLVVLDLVLPKLGGVDVLKFIRADPRLKHVPVVVFSNTPVPEPALESPPSGLTVRLAKADCTFPVLLQTIKGMLASGVSTTATSTAPSTTRGSQALATPTLTDENLKARKEFLSQALAEMPKIREHCFAYIKSPASPASLQHLPSLHQHVHFLSTNAGKAGCARLALLANAFDTLLSEIMAKPSWVTPSVLQTIAQAVDCLGYLLKSNEVDLAQPMPQAKVLAVDDDAVCNHVIVNTLKRANFDAKSIDDPQSALQVLQTTQFDLILLDISMPGLTGFEVCEKLRRFPHCKTTPVIFITGHNNFDNRKQSVLSGGHDFITKPVSPSELALKATIHLLKARVQRAAPLPPAEPKPQEASQPAADNAPQPAVLIKLGRTGTREAKTPMPSTALLPVTESANTGGQNATFPGIPPQPADPLQTPVVEEALQPAASIQRQDGERTNVMPAEALFPTTESSNTGAETAPSPENGQSSFPGKVLRPVPAYQLSHPQTNEIDAMAPQDVFSPTQESADAGIGTALSPDAAIPKIAFDTSPAPESMFTETELRCCQLEAQMAGLLKERDEFQAKLAAQQQTAVKSQLEIEELQERLRQSMAELDHAKTGVHQQPADSSERTRLESEWREQLNAARAECGRKEATLKEKEVRCSRLEAELTGLKQARDEVQGKFSAEQQAVAKSQQELKALQQQMRQSIAEVEHAKVELEQHATERARLEAELREQLNAAKTAAAQTETVLKQKESRCSRLEADLTGLQRVREELQDKFTAEQQKAAKSQQEINDLRERLSGSAAELEQAKAGVAQHSAERTSVESELREQLNAQRTAAGQTATFLKEKDAWCVELEKQLVEVQHTRDELQGKLAAEQQAASKSQQETNDLQRLLSQNIAELEQAKTGLKLQSAERARLESELCEQQKAAEPLAQTEAALKEKDALCGQLLKEVDELRHARDEGQGKLAAEQQATANARQELKEHQDRLSQIVSELEQTKTARCQTETALKEKEARCNQLETELAELQHARDEFQSKLAAEQQATANARQELREHQDRLSQSVSELEQTKTARCQMEAALKEKEVRHSQLEQQLAALQQARDEFQGKLATEQQSAAKAQQELKELQERLNQSSAELEKTKAEAEQRSAERSRLEAELREQLNAAREATGRTESALKEKEARCSQLEAESAGLQHARDEFQRKLAAEQQTTAKAQQVIEDIQERHNQTSAELEKAKAEAEQRSADLHAQLDAARKTAGQTQAALKEREAQCGQLETELVGLRQTRDEFQSKLAAEQQAAAKSQLELKDLQEHHTQTSMELEKAKASAEQHSAERTRLEAEHAGLVKAKEALDQEFCRLREHHTAREAEHQDKHKKLIESLQEHVLNLQASLEEAENLHQGSGNPQG